MAGGCLQTDMFRGAVVSSNYCRSKNAQMEAKAPIEPVAPRFLSNLNGTNICGKRGGEPFSSV